MTNQLSTLRNKYEQAQKLTKKNIHEFMTNDLTEALIKAFCAFGKSPIEVWTMLEYTQKTSLLLLSSLNLLDQFKTEYFDDNKIDNDQFEVFFVCSDRNATTDEKEIKDFLNNNSGRKKKLIVCLYHSFHVLTKVIKKTIGISNIDFVIADESHNLTCNKNSTDGKKLAKTIKNYDDVKKLYFSATPSKEQEEHMIFKYTYLDGVNDGIMQPFDIYLQVALSEEDPHLNDEHQDESEVAIKIFRSMVRNFIETGNNKVMAFHNGVQEINKKSILPVKSFLKYQSLYQEVFEDILEKEYPEKKKEKFSFHIDGLHGEVPEKHRREILHRFDREYNDPNCLYILSSCMTLREGVNTKTANALIWVDPRYTHTMIIQNLGRIIRKHDKTQNGSVIIPIFLDRQLYSQCQTQEKRNEFLREQLHVFNPAVSFLHALKEEDPLIVKYLEFYASTTSSCSNDNNNNNETDTTTITPCLSQERQDVPFKLRMHLNFDKNDFGYNLHLENTLGESMISKLCHTINYDAIAERVDKLIEFTNLIKRVPSIEETYKECNVGRLWDNMKHGKNASFLEHCKQKSTFLKKDYENLLMKREEKKLKPQYTTEEKIELLIECTNLNERVPSVKETYKECNVGRLWDKIKQGHYARFLEHCLEKSTFLKNDYGKSPQDKWKQTCYEAVHWMYTNKKRPVKSQDPAIKQNGNWIKSQTNALNTVLNDKYKEDDNKMRNKARLMKDPTIRQIWSQIKEFMENKQWDDMKNYVNQLKEEDNNINNKETDDDSVDVEDTDKKEEEKDDTDLSSITCSEYEDEDENEDDEDDSCTTNESTSTSLRSKHKRTENQRRETTPRRGPKPRKNGYTISDVLERRPSSFYLLQYGKTQLYKGGRSNCVKTRLKQINNASIRAHAKMFPDTHYVYECIYEQQFDSEDEAHAFEQSFFKNLEKHTDNVDGEYYCIPSDLLSKISNEHNIQLKTSH